MQNEGLLGAIEAGGTKFVLAVARTPGDILARQEIPTLTPEDTLAEAARWFDAQGRLSALGIATFGPAQLDKAAPDWGHILDTPKPGWSHCDLAGYFARKYGIPIGFETDVNGAALAEYRMGAGQGAAGMAYVTVGTGIGGGLVLGGELVHGAGHPEMGHYHPKRAADDVSYFGFCPFHGDCLEGLASGPAILDRWGATLSDLGSEHEAVDRVAGYLGQLCHSLFALTAVETVVLGGGVTKTPGLLGKIAESARLAGNNYLPGRARQKIVPPALGDNAGVTGALLLAEAARAS